MPGYTTRVNSTRCTDRQLQTQAGGGTSTTAFSSTHQTLFFQPPRPLEHNLWGEVMHNGVKWKRFTSRTHKVKLCSSTKLGFEAENWGCVSRQRHCETKTNSKMNKSYPPINHLDRVSALNPMRCSYSIKSNETCEPQVDVFICHLLLLLFCLGWLRVINTGATASVTKPRADLSAAWVNRVSLPLHHGLCCSGNISV